MLGLGGGWDISRCHCLCRRCCHKGGWWRRCTHASGLGYTRWLPQASGTCELLCCVQVRRAEGHGCLLQHPVVRAGDPILCLQANEVEVGAKVWLRQQCVELAPVQHVQHSTMITEGNLMQSTQRLPHDILDWDHSASCSVCSNVFEDSSLKQQSCVSHSRVACRQRSATRLNTKSKTYSNCYCKNSMHAA